MLDSHQSLYPEICDRPDQAAHYKKKWFSTFRCDSTFVWTLVERANLTYIYVSERLAQGGDMLQWILENVFALSV